MTGSGVVRAWHEEEDRVLRLRLEAAPGNIIDLLMATALRQVLADELRPATRALLLDAAGPHFSYGASIQEHAPAVVAPALRAFHALVRELVACPVPVIVAVRGRCLGGGLELALCGDVIHAARDASFATPEVKLGAFAPVASLLLPGRVGDGAARDLLLSGRTIDAAEAQRIGLVQRVDDDPGATALAWIRDHALALSPSSTRFACTAARLVTARLVMPLLEDVERLYLGGLMRTPDPDEGVRAFLEKRTPRWRDPE